VVEDTNIFNSSSSESVSKKADINNPKVKQILEHYPGLKLRKFPLRILDLDFEKDILAAE
jgi:hypothetical protein